MLKNNILTYIFTISFLFTCYNELLSQTQELSIVDTSSEGNYSYNEIFEKLRYMTPNPHKIATVENFQFQRDVANFNLENGIIYLLNPVKGWPISAIFFGEGTVSITPPTNIEQDQLYRYYETRSLQKKIKTLFLIFADSTYSQFERHLNFNDGIITEEVSENIEDGLKFLSRKKYKIFYTPIIKTFLENEPNGLFYSHFYEDKNKPTFFMIDPNNIEEICLMRKASHYALELVCQFHKQSDYKLNVDLANKSKDQIKIIIYTIESTIKSNLDFSAVADIEFTALQEGQQWIHFYLFSDMIVDSAFWDTGEKVEFFKIKENPHLWIKCDSSLKKHCLRKLKLYYHGDLIIQDIDGQYALSLTGEMMAYEEGTSWIYIKSPYGWYPWHGIRKPAFFDLTYHVSDNFTLLSVGDLESSDTTKSDITTHWISAYPINSASFNIGIYDEYEIEDDRVPPVTVFMAKGGHKYGWKKMKEEVGGDIVNGLAFFQHVFGKPPIKKFYVTETPYHLGMAFPGLIHLSWVTFQKTHDKGYSEIFRGHEVAHQWWGIGVDFKTYHDQWLSEGFSEYAGLWFMQMVYKDNEMFFDVLRKYRKEIMRNRKFLFLEGQEAGPIWLGYRTSTSATEGDYDLIIYKKGAWVLHMLRTLMLDLKTMNEDLFTNMLREFYRTYQGKKASTTDFQKIVEKYIGLKMDWFFDQWVYETAIPIYKFSYGTEETAGGKYLVHCMVEQSEVPDDFEMYVPLEINLKGEFRFRYRAHIKGPISEFDLPLLPYKPKKITFNYLESVLCEVEYIN